MCKDRTSVYWGNVVRRLSGLVWSAVKKAWQDKTTKRVRESDKRHFQEWPESELNSLVMLCSQAQPVHWQLILRPRSPLMSLLPDPLHHPIHPVPLQHHHCPNWAGCTTDQQRFPDHPSHPVLLGCRHRPSWARCMTEGPKLLRHSSFPGPQRSLHRPNWAVCISGGLSCHHHHPSRLGHLVGTGHRDTQGPVVQGTGLATRSGVIENVPGFGGIQGSRRKWGWPDGGLDWRGIKGCERFTSEGFGGFHKTKKKIFWGKEKLNWRASFCSA